MTKADLIILWMAAFGASFVAFIARIAYLLYGSGEAPPEDPIELAKWARKRRWLMISELSALPLFATTAVLAVLRGWVDPILAILYALGCGALGFAFLLHTLKALVLKKFGVDKET